jgi:methylated-DNA-[protein]-cysteine S-methyltransferase
MKEWMLCALEIETREGNFSAVFSERGLIRLEFPTERKSRWPACQSGPPSASAPVQWLKLTRQALEQVLAGQAPKQLPPFDLSTGTDFQRSVWKALSAIPLGQTVTYTQLAQTIGRPQAARSVGQACGANPIPVLIPCHRVVAAHGGLGGFSAGLPWKRKLLGVEAALLPVK